jgi:hypothetical protein
VTEVQERMNLTSAVAIARIGRSINDKYKEVAASIGLQTTARGVATAATVVGNRALTFGPTPTGVQKIYSVFDAANPVPMLDEISFDEMRRRSPKSGKARAYAVQTMGSSSVTILLDATPTAIFTWSADAELNLATLSGTQVPQFAEAYHNLLIYAAMAVELDKMEKPDLAKAKLEQCEMRTSQLRLFIAESNQRELYQGKTGSR